MTPYGHGFLVRLESRMIFFLHITTPPQVQVPRSYLNSHHPLMAFRRVPGGVTSQNPFGTKSISRLPLSFSKIASSTESVGESLGKLGKWVFVYQLRSSSRTSLSTTSMHLSYLPPRLVRHLGTCLFGLSLMTFQSSNYLEIRTKRHLLSLLLVGNIGRLVCSFVLQTFSITFPFPSPSSGSPCGITFRL